MFRTKTALILATAAAVLGTAGTASAASGKLTLDGSTTQSTLTGYAWGVTSVPGSAGGGTKPAFDSLKVTKPIDGNSIPLFKSAATGLHLKKATVELPIGTTLVLKYVIEDVTVKSVSQDGSRTTPIETVAFDYGRIKEFVGTSSFGFDLKLLTSF